MSINVMMMKLFMFLLVLAGAITASDAQTDDFAKKLLNEVSKKYSGYKTLKSDFSLQIKGADNTAYSNTGLMYFNKPKQQYRIDLKDEIIMSNGKSTWNIAKEIKEVQVTETDNSGAAIGPNNLFTFYQSGYKHIGMPDESITKNGKTESVNVIEMSPLDTKTNYFKIKLRINKNKHIHDVTIFDKSGNRYTYTINTLYVNQGIPAGLFEFKKEQYPGYELVDLR